jgi:hypothetical protein
VLLEKVFVSWSYGFLPLFKGAGVGGSLVDLRGRGGVKIGWRVLDDSVYVAETRNDGIDRRASCLSEGFPYVLFVVFLAFRT